MVHHAQPKLMERTASCTMGQLSFLDRASLKLYYQSNGNAVCTLTNDAPDEAAMWTASPSFDEIETMLCTGPGCPDIPVTFTCCDPCDPMAKCVTTTATVSMKDSTPPLISGVGHSTMECAAGHVDKIAQWIDTASCVDPQDGSPTLSYTLGQLADGNKCNQVQEVTFSCADNCGNVVTQTAAFNIVDRTPPTVVQPPADRTVNCDGNGNTQDIQLWLSLHGGMAVGDACSGNCATGSAVTNVFVPTHYQ
jgi:hypothetical protein